MAGLAAASCQSLHTQTSMHLVTREMLCVTEGSIQKISDADFAVDAPKMRAYFDRASLQSIGVYFTYLGPSTSEAPLASGKMRQQLGLKLRAQDACNVVYAMWRIEPDPDLVVSVKFNPDQHTSAQCGNHGYQTIEPLHHTTLPLLHAGDKHELRAEMNDDTVRVFVDNAEMWDGIVDRQSFNFSGPVGIRTDNTRLDFRLHVGQSSGPQPHYVLGCKSDPEP